VGVPGFGRIPPALIIPGIYGPLLLGSTIFLLPINPYTGRIFRYEPKGLRYCVSWRGPNTLGMKALAPGRPLLACDSWTTKVYEASTDGESQPSEGRAGEGSLRTEVWEDVWVFPIP
jgi:hypothetical protein